MTALKIWFAILMVMLAPAAVQARLAPVAVVSAHTTVQSGVYTVVWRLSEPKATADLYVSKRPDALLGALKAVALQDRANMALIRNPLGPNVRPYFYIVPNNATRGLWTATRVVPMQGASNFRDLGGYAAADGRHVLWAELFRSNGLSNLTDADYKTIDALGIKVVCDLRTDQERQSQPTIWKGENPKFVISPKAKLDFDLNAALGPSRTDAAHVRRYLLNFYRQMLDLYAPEYRALFHELLAGDTPLIVHCTAGKDRTGLGSALILVALGVPRDTIVSDYALSGPLLLHHMTHSQAGAAKQDPSAALFQGLSPEVVKALLATDPAYIKAALDEATTEYGSVNGYLDKKLGVEPKDILILRARYLQ